jgi:hypothetical protein
MLGRAIRRFCEWPWSSTPAAAPHPFRFGVWSWQSASSIPHAPDQACLTQASARSLIPLSIFCSIKNTTGSSTAGETTFIHVFSG